MWKENKWEEKEEIFRDTDGQMRWENGEKEGSVMKNKNKKVDRERKKIEKERNKEREREREREGRI